MNLHPVTFEAPEESLVIIDEIASNMEVDRATVLREALTFYLADYEHLKAELAQADREIEAGETIPHEDVVAWVEAQHPRARATEAA